MNATQKQLAIAQQAVHGRIVITEAMHVAACKVLLRAHGLDGLPQRMLDAMLAAAPAAPECTRSHPHEDMGEACQRKTEEARAANAARQVSRPLCRDCADFGPICPNSGLPCGGTEAAPQAEQQAGQAPAEGDVYGWAYTVNGAHQGFVRGAEPPPDDAYDAGTLVALYTGQPQPKGTTDERWQLVGASSPEEYAQFQSWLSYGKPQATPSPAPGAGPLTADECDRLLKTVRYMQGIAERGEGRPMRDDETVEEFVLGYVQRLEAAQAPAVADGKEQP